MIFQIWEISKKPILPKLKNPYVTQVSVLFPSPPFYPDFKGLMSKTIKISLAVGI